VLHRRRQQPLVQGRCPVRHHDRFCCFLDRTPSARAEQQGRTVQLPQVVEASQLCSPPLPPPCTVQQPRPSLDTRPQLHSRYPKTYSRRRRTSPHQSPVSLTLCHDHITTSKLRTNFQHGRRWKRSCLAFSTLEPNSDLRLNAICPRHASHVLDHLFVDKSLLLLLSVQEKQRSLLFLPS
ncbi:hypothetical protein CERZMDRAFT_108110, partial [Cercospora zeae-maydis SCOH1-5]